jgi:hypothetical protein
MKQMLLTCNKLFRNFPDAKTRNEINFDNWTLEIIPFIQYLIQMDRTERSTFLGGKC